MPEVRPWRNHVFYTVVVDGAVIDSHESNGRRRAGSPRSGDPVGRRARHRRRPGGRVPPRVDRRDRRAGAEAHPYGGEAGGRRRRLAAVGGGGGGFATKCTAWLVQLHGDAPCTWHVPVPSAVHLHRTRPCTCTLTQPVHLHVAARALARSTGAGQANAPPSAAETRPANCTARAVQLDDRYTMNVSTRCSPRPNRSSPNGSIGIDTALPVISSARCSPTAGDCWKPWPEKPVPT